MLYQFLAEDFKKLLQNIRMFVFIVHVDEKCTLSKTNKFAKKQKIASLLSRY